MQSGRDQSPSAAPRPGSGTDRWLRLSLVALAIGLAVNSLLGPMGLAIVDYPLSETLRNQTIGLEAVTLVLVAPWSVAAAVLLGRNRSVGSVLSIPPSAYAAYMFSQYVVGPQYSSYPAVLPLHFAIFVLAVFVLVRAWSRVEPDALPDLSPRRERTVSAVLLLLAGFIVSRYLPVATGVVTGESIPAEFADDPAMYWLIFLLDLGLVVPATVGTAVGLLQGADWARRALYGLIGWYALVPVSVAAMALVMLINDDPNAGVAPVFVLSTAAVLFGTVAAWIYRPLLHESHSPGRDASGRRFDSERDQ